MRALMRLFNLLEDPFTYICIRTAAIAREFLENSAQFTHTFRAFFADEATFNQLHLGSMGHRHTKTLLICMMERDIAGGYADRMAEEMRAN
jgi:hypothetical protein